MSNPPEKSVDSSLRPSISVPTAKTDIWMGRYFLSFFLVLILSIVGGVLAHTFVVPIAVVLIFLLVPLSENYFTSRRLVMEEDRFLYTGKGVRREIRWESLGRVRCSFECRSPRRLEFFDRNGTRLLSLSVRCLPFEEVSELLSIIAVRLPQGVSVEEKITNLQTRVRYFICGVICGIPALYWRTPGFFDDWPFTIVLIGLPLGISLRCLGIAILGHKLEKARAQIRPEYRNVLYPYIRWQLAGLPLPGARSFQYRSEVTPLTVERRVKRNRVVTNVVLGLMLLVFCGCLIAGCDPIGLICTVLIPYMIIAGILLSKGDGVQEVKGLGQNLHDEILLDETSIFIWHAGQLSEAMVAETPQLMKSKEILSSSLTLKVGKERLKFDSAAMQIVDSIR